MHRILSIQSHVVHGYVGNKCATFPLQLLGFEVDNLNSVQLSNHTGYKHFKGQVLNSGELEDLIDGLRLNHLQNYSHILTGYVGSTSFLSKVAEVVKEFKAYTPSLTYGIVFLNDLGLLLNTIQKTAISFLVCDPVLGDNGKMYVPKENLPVYIDQLIPLADIMTPNQYETEWLTSIKIVDVSSAVKAMSWFHDKGVKVVVITSTNISKSSNPEFLTGFASQIVIKEGAETRQQFQFHVPYLSGQFTGVGDLFSAVFTAWMAKTNQNLKISCEKSLSTLHHVMKRTLSVAQNESCCNGAPSTRQTELQLIKSKNDIEDPSVVVTVESLEV